MALRAQQYVRISNRPQPVMSNTYAGAKDKINNTHIAENRSTETQVFLHGKPEREKPWGSTNPKKQITM